MVNCGGFVCVSVCEYTACLCICSCVLTTLCRSVHSDPKVWMHLLQELGSRCEHSTKTEKACSKTSLFTHSKSMRHRGGEAQTAAFPQYTVG